MSGFRRVAEAFGGVPKLATNAKLNATTPDRTLSRGLVPDWLNRALPENVHGLKGEIANCGAWLVSEHNRPSSRFSVPAPEGAGTEAGFDRELERDSGLNLDGSG